MPILTLYSTSSSSLTTNILSKWLLQGQTGCLTSQRLQKKSKFWRELKPPYSCAHTWFSTANDWYIGVAFLVNIERELDYFGREGQIVMLQTLWFPKSSRAGQRNYHSVNFWLCSDTWTMFHKKAMGIIRSHISEKSVQKNHFTGQQQRQQRQGEKYRTATSKALKIWVSFSKLQSWTLQLQHLQIVYTQDSRKIPTVKGSVCFWSECVKFTPAEDPVLGVEFIELQPNPL